MFGIIYMIRNNITNKVYIGQTWMTMKERWYAHCSKNNGCIKLRNSIQKYGKHNFTMTALTTAHTQENMDYWEQYFIDKYNSIKEGYNLKDGGAKGKLSAETKSKISKSLIGNKRSVGREYSAEQRKQISDSLLGRPSPRKGTICSDEQKAKTSASMKGRKSHQKGRTWKLIDSKRVYFTAEGVQI